MSQPLSWPGTTGTNPHPNSLSPPVENRPHVVVFKVGRQHFGLPLPAVVRAFRMVALTPLPDAPAWVSGVFNLHGDVIRAISLRQRLGLPPQEIRLSDRLLLVNGEAAPFALIVDQITEVMAVDPGQLRPALDGSLELVDAVIEQPEKLVLVLNPTRLPAARKR